MIWTRWMYLSAFLVLFQLTLFLCLPTRISGIGLAITTAGLAWNIGFVKGLWRDTQIQKEIREHFQNVIPLGVNI